MDGVDLQQLHARDRRQRIGLGRALARPRQQALRVQMQRARLGQGDWRRIGGGCLLRRAPGRRGLGRSVAGGAIGRCGLCRRRRRLASRHRPRGAHASRACKVARSSACSSGCRRAALASS
ncbi:hypothetical protein [Lysobacter gummosus]|uniref:hypothetical protein n=1 Tax=Lysobacter gummosus TaxID=262324 RepID=UPI003636F42F